MISTKAVKPTLQLAYVKLMMDVVGRGLVMASQVDSEIQEEVSKFPVHFVLSISVHDKFHRTLILSGFCLLKIAKISL
ncbi:hypothetical protein ABTI43_17265, partial [Acinetobacter baumannii]